MSAEHTDEPSCKCSRPHDDWPDKDGGMLCQMCWEAECSESWWQMVRALDAARRVERERGEG